MLALIAIICFPYLFWTAWKNIRLARASAAWPSVPGTITGSERGKVAWRAVPRVTYTYRVEGNDYSGRNITIGGLASGKETDSVLARYPLGAPVTVHYAPREPATATLEPGPNRYANAVLRTYIVWFAVIILSNVVVYLVNTKLPSGDDVSAKPRTYDDEAKADPGLGDRLIREGADKGDAKDESYVATWYLGGTEGYPKDPVEAAKWFRKAADQGEASSQNLLGELYVQGKGVPKDYTQAIQWFQKAADQGEPHACVWVGVAYQQGIAGMPKDTQKAIEWYKKAGNEPKAKEMLARLGVH